ncbi:hypothetical protein [Burkholderia cepacia]|uniref:hypothetical protein n=1 Tax=Burkholderia cepacia TaxID=292 RepID=UPI000F59004A|nr:hypothetical protein [Burkholderia cepacia]
MKVLESNSIDVRISVSSVCRAGGINRASLYAHHRNLVEEILTRSRGSKVTRPGRPGAAERLEELTERVKASEARYQALLVICIEQQAQIAALRLQIETKRSKRS